MSVSIFISVMLVLFSVAEAFSLIDSMHFFQLNSYRFDTHTKWMRENMRKYLPHEMFSVIMLIEVSLIMPPKVKAIALSVLFFFAIFSEKPKKAKKPLVYTPRVKRMFFTVTVFCAAVLLVTEFFTIKAKRESYFLFAVVLLYAASPFLVLLANFINKPVELSINRYYTEDAKKLLRSHENLNIIGITGSYGKTSVKYYLTTLLKSKYNVLMTPESYNTPMGVVKTIRSSLKPTDEIFVCEMGAKWTGDIKELCDIVHPKHGIITSIGPQHLESFKTLDAVKSTKFELADSLGEDGLLFLNADDENVMSKAEGRKYISYSIEKESDYKAFDIKVSEKGTSFSVQRKDGERETYQTKLIGRHNVLNIVGAIAVSNKMGISLRELKGAVRRLEGVPHRLELKDNGLLTIIDDAYNSNPSGAKAALETLSLFGGYKILVTPGMVELGEKQYELNKEFGKQASDVCDFAVLVGQKQAVPIKEGLLEMGFDEKKIFVANTINEALSFVYGLDSESKKKIVLLENDLPDNY